MTAIRSVALRGSALHARGDVNPHEIERPRQLRPDVCHAGRAPALPVAALFVQDRISMVERVEGLRQPERVFWPARKCGPTTPLTAPPGEPRRLENHRPEAMAGVVVLGEFVGGGRV